MTSKPADEDAPSAVNDEDSVQYESLINITNVMSSDSFAAVDGTEPIIERKQSNEDDAPESGETGGLELDASFFEELWKEAVNTIKNTKTTK